MASIKPEISQALESLCEELQTSEDAKAMRAAVSYIPKPKQNVASISRNRKVCPLCKAAKRPDSHFLSKCSFLPPQDRRFLVKARQVVGSYDELEVSDDSDAQPHEDADLVQRVVLRQSPYFDTFHGHIPVRLTIDSGATGNMMKASCATRLGVKITSSTQSAHQADGSSLLKVIGETRTSFCRDGHELYFEGLVVDNLDTDVLAGIPFMERNDVSIRPAKREVLLKNTHVYMYGSMQTKMDRHAVRRACVVRAPTKSVVWPGDFIELDLPGEFANSDGEVAVEPHCGKLTCWPNPSIVTSISGKIRLPNLTDEPLYVKKNDHVCKIRATIIPDECVSTTHAPTKTIPAPKPSNFSRQVNLDPDRLMPDDMRAKFREVLKDFDNVFNPNFKGYNGAAGAFQTKVNMGPVQPPQRKGRVPQYSRNQLQELQAMFDELEDKGVFCRPEDVNVSVEYVNPSFLVKKQSGGFRLVTAFSDVGRYSKPQPSLMPDVDSTLRHIAQWKYIIATDLTQAFYQIPLSRDSMKYCGVVTPFKGVRVYTRTAMGMPGSETALEELTCRVLGDLVEQGHVVKLADDLYCGANTLEDLLNIWKSVLSALRRSNLSLSAHKTVIAPRGTTILGWIWRLGSIQASPHRIAALSSCPPPANVTGLRSFIGAYKVLARVVKNTATLLSALDDAVAGRDSKESLHWTDELLHVFTSAQKALSTNRAITLPRPDDQLWIVTDGAVRDPGLGATLYISRGDKVEVAGYFSAKLRKNQVNWLPCEVEALSIAAAIKHFSPYIIQSSQTACVLTDSKPCVQAFGKLCRGEFSASPRVTTFLSTASRYQVTLRHVAGSAILPSDFASRNAPECTEPTCQICAFVQLVSDTVVRRVSTGEILDGSAKLPFTSRSAWLAIQSECADLRRTCAHLRQGTRPSKKLTNIRDVKRYLNVATLSRDDLLVVRRHTPLAPSTDCIIVPRQVLDGLLTSLHIKLDHPTLHQLKTMVNRYFYALDLDAALHRVSDGCHQCAALKKVPSVVQEQTTSPPSETVGCQFAADVIKRERQLILVVRECVTSYTSTMILDDERRDSLREGLIRLCIELHPLDGPFALVRTDPAPGFKALVDDDILAKYRLSIDIGNAKNPNKNPVAEKAIQELEDEILRLDPGCRGVSPLLLSLATARLNTRIRGRGLSSREMWTQRDQFFNRQIPVEDHNLILRQNATRLANHPHSETSKAPSGRVLLPPHVTTGDLVYLHLDRNKSMARDRYLVVSVENPWCNIRKFVGNQLRQSSYRVKKKDCFKVEPSDCPSRTHSHSPSEPHDSDVDEDMLPCGDVTPPAEPDIPMVISEPPELPTHRLRTELNAQQDLNIPQVPLNDSVGVRVSDDPVSANGSLRRSDRNRHTPVALNDYVLY